MRSSIKQSVIVILVVLMGISMVPLQRPDDALADEIEKEKIIPVPIDPSDSGEGVDEDSVSTCLNNGFAQLKMGNYREAADEFTKVIEMNDSEYTPAAYRNRGLAWLSEGNYDKAIEDLTKFIDSDSGNAPDYVHQGIDAAYLNRGVAWLQKGNYDRALSDFTCSISINPRNVQAYYNRGLTWMKKKDYQKALADAKEALRLEPNESRYHALIRDLEKILTS